MAKVYRKKNGIMVISGPVVRTAPAPGGATDVVIRTEEYDPNAKKWNSSEWTVRSAEVDPTLAIGSIATSYGYQSAPNGMAAQKITVGPATQIVDETTEIVSGPIHKAEYKPEVNDDGTPKLKRDGTPRKPHFDVVIVVPDEMGHKVHHTIRIYNFKNAEGSTEIEKAQAKFKDFKSSTETPTEITVVTSPAPINTWESEWNGRMYTNYGCDHLGKRSWDVNVVGAPARTQTAEQSAPTPAPAPAPASVTPPPAPALGPANAYGIMIEDEDVFES